MKMRSLILWSVVSWILVSLIACGDSSQGKPDEAPGPDAAASVQADPAPPPPPTDSVVRLDGSGSTAPGTVPQAGTAEGMNPAHGQPNHRCDIPVGAPLNSPPGKPPGQPGGSPQAAIPQSPPAPTAPGMNPPHGQPDHRCDIPVGAPLSSPPGKLPRPAPAAGTAPTPAK